MKGLPLGYNKDLQEDKAIAFEAEDMVTACARTTATVIRTLVLRPSVTRAAASGLLLATEVADYLVARGLPFRPAHEVTGRIVRDLYDGRQGFLARSTWTAGAKYHTLFDADVLNVVTPEAAVAAQKTPQSTNPQRSRPCWPRPSAGSADALRSRRLNASCSSVTLPSRSAPSG